MARRPPAGLYEKEPGGEQTAFPNKSRLALCLFSHSQCWMHIRIAQGAVPYNADARATPRCGLPVWDGALQFQCTAQVKKPWLFIYLFNLYISLKDFYLFLKDTQREAETQDRQGRSRVSARSPMQDWIPGHPGSRPEPKTDAQAPSHPGVQSPVS